MSDKSSGLKVMSWNVGGAKFLKLPKSSSSNDEHILDRHEFRRALNDRLEDLLTFYRPDFVILQEIVQYECNPNPFNLITRELDDYYYLPTIAIDTINQNHPAKWRPYRKKGKWSDEAYLAQGYGLLWKKNIKHCPIFWDFKDTTQLRSDYHLQVEIVHIDTGLYSGDRDTEPRLAVVAHFVVEAVDGPLDIFLINLHLTTLKGEREGVPTINNEGKNIREKQLDIIIDGIVARYNKWWNAKTREVNIKRHPLIWFLGGDFNCLPESSEIKKITDNDFIRLFSDNHPTKASGLGGKASITLDYIFAGLDKHSINDLLIMDDFKYKITDTSKTIIDCSMVSDHYPILVPRPY